MQNKDQDQKKGTPFRGETLDIHCLTPKLDLVTYKCI